MPERGSKNTHASGQANGISSLTRACTARACRRCRACASRSAGSRRARPWPLWWQGCLAVSSSSAATPAGWPPSPPPARSEPDLEVIALERGAPHQLLGLRHPVRREWRGRPIPTASSCARPTQHRANGIDVRIGHEAIALDVDAGVRRPSAPTTRSYDLGYDALLLGMGGEPIRPPLPGIDLPFVRGVQTLDDGEALLALRLDPLAASAWSWSAAATSGWRWPRPSCSGASR